jgi:hypothetical protein
MWDPLKATFIDQLDEVNADLKKLGLPPIERAGADAGMKGIKINGQ